MGYVGVSDTPHMNFSKPGQVAPNTVFKVILTFSIVPQPLPRLPPRHFQPSYPHMPGKARSPSNTISASQTSSAETNLALHITSPPCCRWQTQTTISLMGQGDPGSLGHQSVQTGRGAELLAEQALLSPSRSWNYILFLFFFFFAFKHADWNIRPRSFPSRTIYASSLPPATLHGFVTEIGSDFWDGHYIMVFF